MAKPDTISAIASATSTQASRAAPLVAAGAHQTDSLAVRRPDSVTGRAATYLVSPSSSHRVDIAGGASTVRQALVAGVVDELTLDIAPVLLGCGERIFDGVDSFGLEPVEVLHSPLATHIRYGRAS